MLYRIHLRSKFNQAYGSLERPSEIEFDNEVPGHAGILSGQRNFKDMDTYVNIVKVHAFTEH